jgi:hypothetical protein
MFFGVLGVACEFCYFYYKESFTNWIYRKWRTKNKIDGELKLLGNLKSLFCKNKNKSWKVEPKYF